MLFRVPIVGRSSAPRASLFRPPRRQCCFTPADRHAHVASLRVPTRGRLRYCASARRPPLHVGMGFLNALRTRPGCGGGRTVRHAPGCGGERGGMICGPQLGAHSQHRGPCTHRCRKRGRATRATPLSPPSCTMHSQTRNPHHQVHVWLALIGTNVCGTIPRYYILKAVGSCQKHGAGYVNMMPLAIKSRHKFLSPEAMSLKHAHLFSSISHTPVRIRDRVREQQKKVNLCRMVFPTTLMFSRSYSFTAFISKISCCSVFAAMFEALRSFLSFPHPFMQAVF